MPGPRLKNVYVPSYLRELLREAEISVQGLRTMFQTFFDRLVSLLLEAETVDEDVVIKAGLKAWESMAQDWFRPPERKVLQALKHDRKHIEQDSRQRQRVSLGLLADEAGCTETQLRRWHAKGEIDLSYRGGPWARGTMKRKMAARPTEEDEWSRPTEETR